MLNDYNRDNVGSSEVQRCKPDYESIIARCKAKITANTTLTEAIFGYVGNRRLNGGMAEMVGELVSEHRQLEKEIENLIAAQEADSSARD